MSDIADRVKKIVVENLDVEGDKVVESASFIDDLGADSLDLVELNPFLDERVAMVLQGVWMYLAVWIGALVRCV